MILRKTEEKDRRQVLGLWNQARLYFKEKGIDQWQDGYPNGESLDQDMKKEESYVLVEENGTVLATAFISFDGEPDYRVIYDGSWQGDSSYCVVHRVAVLPDRKGQGLAGMLIDHAAQMCRERKVNWIRMDTHEDNRSMRRMLAKNGFQYRGIIYLGRDGARRVAYERNVQQTTEEESTGRDRLLRTDT